MAALILVVLILLLALTVRHAREKESVAQFGMQQMSLARGLAVRFEELVVSVARGLETIAAGAPTGAEAQRRIALWPEGRRERILIAALTDATGAILVQAPDGGPYKPGEIGSTELFRQVRVTGRSAVGLLPGSGGEAYVAVAVPRQRPGGNFAGAVFAVLNLAAFDDDRQRFDAGITHVWFFDSSGRWLYHPSPAMVGRDVQTVELPRREDTGLSLKQRLTVGGEGYGEHLLQSTEGMPVRQVVSHASFPLPPGRGAVAVATPYEHVIADARKTFLIIQVGAAGLALTVIIAAAAIFLAVRRGLLTREAEDRLRQQDAWQDQLLREKRTVEGIIEGSPIPTFVLDRNHKIILWNRACKELTGYAAETMIGTENQSLPFYGEKRPVIADLILERDFESIEKYYGTKKVRKSPTVPGAYEARDFYRNLGGQNRHLYFLAAPICDEKGEMRAAIETIQDVSKEEELSSHLREYAENLQNELQENIRLREEIESLYNYLQSIVDSLPDRLFVLNGDGMIHYISRNVREGLGMIPPQYTGTHFLDFVAPENRGLMLAKWEEAKRGIHAPYEIEVKAADGSRRVLLISSGPIHGTDRYVVIQRDITELKDLEARFYESQKMAAVGQLSAGIAHEVRNPLSSIKMSLQILLKRIHPTGNDLKRFEIALREVEHLEKLVNDVLVFAKPATPRKEPTDLRRVVEHALALAEKAIAEKEIQVSGRFADALPLLEVDAAMLAQAFLNLILNAVDAMERGGTLQVIIREGVQPDGRSVEVEWIDDGCGVGEEDLPHLFNPFFTKKKYGTGLGLTQVKKIVDLHGGIITVTSRRGTGTRIRIRFPLTGDAGVTAIAGV